MTVARRIGDVLQTVALTSLGVGPFHQPSPDAINALTSEYGNSTQCFFSQTHGGRAVSPRSDGGPFQPLGTGRELDDSAERRTCW